MLEAELVNITTGSPMAAAVDWTARHLGRGMEAGLAEGEEVERRGEVRWSWGVCGCMSVLRGKGGEERCDQEIVDGI